MEGNRYCTRCGAELMDGASFCKECGSPVGGYAKPYQTRGCGTKTGPFLAIIILIYGILAIISGLLSCIGSIGLTESSYQTLIDMSSSMLGIDASGMYPAWSPELAVFLPLSFAFMTVSGALAVLCYIKFKKADDWKTAVILCAASSVACLGMCCFSANSGMGVIQFVIGSLMTVLLYTSRNTFNA